MEFLSEVFKLTGEMIDFKFLQKVIRRYNEEMDKLDFLERIKI